MSISSSSSCSLAFVRFCTTSIVSFADWAKPTRDAPAAWPLSMSHALASAEASGSWCLPPRFLAPPMAIVRLPAAPRAPSWCMQLRGAPAGDGEVDGPPASVSSVLTRSSRRVRGLPLSPEGMMLPRVPFPSRLGVVAATDFFPAPTSSATASEVVPPCPGTGERAFLDIIIAFISATTEVRASVLLF